MKMAMRRMRIIGSNDETRGKKLGGEEVDEGERKKEEYVRQES